MEFTELMRKFAEKVGIADLVPERGEKFKDAGFKKKLKEVDK